MSTTTLSEKNQQWQRQILHIKLSTIFKYKVSNTPQSFGSFLSLTEKDIVRFLSLSKYLGYDIATARAMKKDKMIGRLGEYGLIELPPFKGTLYSKSLWST
jgi:hypothetical protein